MVDVFISYAREDREAAKKLAHALEVEGYSVWWDPAIPPGKKWAEVIGTQLGTARCVVVLWSAVSVAKRWVHKEANFADARNKLIPAKLEDVTIPFEFADVQAANLGGWEGDTSHDGFRHLVSAISEQLRNPPSEQTEEDIVVATKHVEDQLAESQGTQGQPIGEKTKKLPIKAAWKRFRAYVGLPDRQTLLSKKAIIICGVSVVLLVSLLSILTLTKPPAIPDYINKDIPGWVPIYTAGKIENVMNGKYGGNFSVEPLRSPSLPAYLSTYMDKDLAHSIIDFYANALEAEGFETKRANDGYSVSGKNDATGRTVAATARPGTIAAVVTFSTSK